MTDPSRHNRHRHDTFPRQYARTRRLTLGEPRNLVVSPDGQRIVFIRSRSGDDPINCLYMLDVATGEERLIADPSTLLEQADPDDVCRPRNGPSRAHARDGIGRHDVRDRLGCHASSPFRSPAGCSSPA